jgi:hypothetical protein
MTRSGRRFHWLGPIAGAALVSLTASACRDVLGIDDRHVEERPPPELCAGASAFEATCASCLDESCCDTLAACRGDESCARVLACFAECRGEPASITACRLRCGKTLQTSFDLFTSRLMSCQGKSCSNACGLTCGGYVHPNALCESCVARLCCAETSACVGDPQCLALSTCLAACASRDGPCILACRGEHAGGAALRDGFAACIDRSCAGTCYDAAWACLGKTPPPDVPATIALVLVAVDLVTARPLPGLDVRVCLDSDGPCNGDGSPDQVTDPNGMVRIEVPSLRDRCIRVSGPSVRTMCVSPPPYAGTTMAALAPLIRNVDYARLFPPPLPSDTNGSVLFIAHDCAGLAGSGVSFTTPSAVRTLYWRRERFEDGLTFTDGSGLGAMLDVPGPAAHLVRADLGLGLPAIGQRTVFVRPGVISGVDLTP